jgi:PPOX class probable F420-dependent enzyme
VSHVHLIDRGAWRSLVARVLWEHEAAGSNPAAPTAMDLDRAREFMRDHHHAVLANRRRDGIQQSPVLVNVDGEGRAIISSRETAYKVRNLRRDPSATVCVMNDGFFGRWVQLEGRATIVPLPEAMEGLVDYYRRISGEHPDWDEYRRAMEQQRRVLIRIPLERVGPNLMG